jgi:hypothetical protein
MTRRATPALGLVFGTLAVLALAGTTAGQPPKQQPKTKVGLLVNEPKASQGYTLLAPLTSNNTYLIDMHGRVVRTWKSDCNPGASAYLLPNGHLLRAGQVKDPPFFFGGAGGRLQEFTWDGELVWDFTLASATRLAHHDVCKLANGNVLMIVWETKSAKEAIAAGRRPETVKLGHLHADCILEIQPKGKTGGTVVWEWHTWDHLIQDFDSKAGNFGDVAAHPELIDINFGTGTLAAIVARPDELKKLRAIGYLGGPPGKKGPPQAAADWLHTNAVAYNAELDQIMLSVHEFNEIWIIDHSTTRAEAAGHKGGKAGRGGDLLYRWGNPRAYRAGTAKNQKLFGQHNAHWISKGLPGAGHVLIFNNGVRRSGGAHSTVDEIVLPAAAKGTYELRPGQAYGPDKVYWSYAAPKKSEFFSSFISGAERQPNGNTLICSGANGTLFEVTPTKDTVWKYVVPLKGGFGGPGRGQPKGPPFGGPPRPGQLLPPFFHGLLNLTDEQKKQLEAEEKGFAEKLDQLLTSEQQKKLKDGPPAFGPGGPPRPGQLLPAPVQEQLKLTDDQKKHLAGLQKEADGKLDILLGEGQRKLLKDMQGGKKGPGGFGGPPPGLFRAPRYAPHYPGLVGRTLTPGVPLEDLLKEAPKKPKEK